MGNAKSSGNRLGPQLTADPRSFSWHPDHQNQNSNVPNGQQPGNIDDFLRKRATKNCVANGVNYRNKTDNRHSSFFQINDDRMQGSAAVGDSGYFTDANSGKKHPLKGSRLSLNEAVFVGNQDIAPPAPLFAGPPPFPIGCPPFNHFPYAPPPHPFNPFFGPLPPPPDFDRKKLKKWRKEQKRLAKKKDNNKGYPVAFFGPPPSMAPPRNGCPPNMSGGETAYYKARSMDNLSIRVQSAPYQQSSPDQQKQYESGKMEIGRKGNGLIDSMTGRSDRLKTNGASVPSSSSGRTSRHSRQEATHFEEQRLVEGCESTPKLLHSYSSIDRYQLQQQQQQQQQQKQIPNNKETTIEKRSTFLADIEQNKNQTILATAEISAGKHSVADHRAEAVQQEEEEEEEAICARPPRVSAQARAIIERANELFPAESVPSSKEKKDTSMVELLEEKQPSIKGAAVGAQDRAVQTLDTEQQIQAVVRSIPTRPKPSRPRQFEPLAAWRAIDVSNHLLSVDQEEEEQKKRVEEVQEELIEARLVPARPSGAPSLEPVYSEYAQKLPDFKKRLIETGSFDISDYDRRIAYSTDQQPALTPTPTIPRPIHGETEEEKKRVVQNQEDVLSLDERQNGLGRQREEQRYSEERDKRLSMERKQKHQMETKTYQSLNGSLTPSTVTNIRTAGDMSDIDFSWVHDMERRLLHQNEPQSARAASTSKSEEGGDNGRMEMRYFGCMTDTRPEHRKELEAIQSDVRSKTAMFESEAIRSLEQLKERRQQINRNKQNRNSWAASVATHEDGFITPPFIPNPDYYQHKNEPFYKRQSNDSLSIDTKLYNRQQQQRQSPFIREENGPPISPSERRIRRLQEMQRHQHSAGTDHHHQQVLSNGWNEPTHSANRGRLVPSNGQPGGYNKRRCDSVELLRSYDATEYYRQNILPQRERLLLETKERRANNSGIGAGKGCRSEVGHVRAAEHSNHLAYRYR